jgi:hypothetical protein
MPTENKTTTKASQAPDKPVCLTTVEIEIIIANLHDYADCLYEQAGWCGSEEDALSLREDAAESIALAEKLKAWGKGKQS